jgi:nucleotidyltransferase substrate binding protein (TIGR01987 family)
MTTDYTSLQKYHFKFINFQKAFILLGERILILKNDPDNDLIQAGVIQTFEFTFELGWKLLKSYMSYKGIESDFFPRNVIKLAFQNGVISNGQVWLEALESRNKTSHTYNGKFAGQLSTNIIQSFYPAFEEIYNVIKTDYDKE